MTTHAYPTAESRPSLRNDVLLSTAIFLAALAIFYASPISGMGDSVYSLLVTQNLISHGSFMLDDFVGHQPGAATRPGVRPVQATDYQIEIVNGHYYDFFPPGTSILSMPFVAIGDCFGYAVGGRAHLYHIDREEHEQRVIASLLMAFLGVVFYLTGRLLLPAGWSACLALGGLLGTQVWSTASRDLGNHTWGILLLGSVIYQLLAHETGRHRLRPILLATVLSWTYFVRPTNSLAIIGVTVYLLLFGRSFFVAYAVTGAAWFAAFVVYSWEHFGTLQPAYYQAKRLESTQYWEAVAGNLISPSRGMLVFVPVTLFVLYLLARHGRRLLHLRLVGLAAAVSVAQVLLVSDFTPWWGGYCYGPRYTTELVPWLVLAAAIGVEAARRWQAELGSQAGVFEWHATMAAGGVLLLASVFINSRGATTTVPREWNTLPVSLDVKPSRIWDWRQPQFLAGLVSAPLPDVFPVVANGQRVAFGNEAGRAYQWEGWSGSDADFCWSNGRAAKLIFATGDTAAKRLRLCFWPALSKRTALQRVTILINGRQIAALTVQRDGAQEYAFELPAGVLKAKNVLTFLLPDAFSPRSQGEGNETRRLGIGLRWMEVD